MLGFIQIRDLERWFTLESSLRYAITHSQHNRQREIVKEYNAIQNRITLNQQLIQKLEETLLKAIYKQWFVDF